ncbi:30S ribosomal protein S13 [Candidatus Peregrinibacteria bacterium CG11_big_fil_rev_8_21_14_0_20_41_10]|nr:MAG: 30S ribosomal protein S13 [Candidatus Peregrinibacteria bacterium CG11_big_fil_rev_8_21_14_0_20_41_10]PIZ75707.1 MAG: 30S ribosomal protein S13 [Candidatus Peregrinibacteria bacterium CG_4_10_14_0_2_um_filter_41_8]PJC37985.1 MAG: 30S ribosomal protein S13 [Candidatus Peregrinibacteria bacterium CG_4_9_14_0_2_um_filter_41_14]
MARIVGVTLPDEKRIVIALTYIYGIGNSVSKELLTKLNIDFNKRTKELTESELNELQAEIAKITTEGDLQRKHSMDIKRLQEIGSYRGVRHRKRLPVRGQRTQCNARTRKGHKRLTVAGKKKATK